MISKYIVVVSMLAAVAAASGISSEKQSTDLVFNYGASNYLRSNARYHVVMGKRINGDVMQFEELVQASSGSTVKFNINPKLRINAIILIDMNQSGNGDVPIVLDGGIGKTYVKLQLRSVVNKEVKFFVTIYGH